MTGAAYCALACAYLGDAGRAVVLHEQLLPYAELNVVTGLGISYVGSVELYLGVLAATAARWDDADRHFTSARVIHERLRSPPWEGHTDYEHARMLMARGRPEDGDRARDLLASAQATAEALGMTRLSELVLAQQLAAPRVE